jgi:hypothetical protein
MFPHETNDGYYYVLGLIPTSYKFPFTLVRVLDPVFFGGFICETERFFIGSSSASQEREGTRRAKQRALQRRHGSHGASSSGCWHPPGERGPNYQLAVTAGREGGCL